MLPLPLPFVVPFELEAGAEGFPRPNENCFFEASSEGLGVVEGGVKNEEEAVGIVDGAARVEAGLLLEPDNEKKPCSSGFKLVLGLAFPLPILSGESGSATIDPAASGDDARGRVEFRRERGPPVDLPLAGTPNEEEPELAAGPIRPSNEVPESPADDEEVGSYCAFGVGGAKPNDIPVKEDGRVILACSSSSMSGKSSSRAEYLPPLGDTARELPADETCVLLVISVRARKLDDPLGSWLSARGAYVDE